MNLDKIQIVIIIVIAVLGVSAGIAFQTYTASKYTYTVVNQTNSSTNPNNTQNNNQTSSNTTNNQFISESQALSIAESAMPGGTSYKIDEYPTSDSPYYLIARHNSKEIGPGGFVKINAITGEIVMKGT